MYQIPFTQKPFTPDDDLIPGNSKSETPVKFYLSAAGGPDSARLRGLLQASLNLLSPADWTGEMQAAVVAGLENGRDMFVKTVDKIDFLTVPGCLAKKVGLVPLDRLTGSNALGDEDPWPIPDGVAFSRVCEWVTGLAFAVGMEILKLSKKADELDPRFFAQPSGSQPEGTSVPTPGTAGNAPKPSGRRGTAGKRRR